MEGRDQFDKTLRTAGEIGIPFNDLLDMDIRQFNSYVDGYTLRRETKINDELFAGQAIASKIAQAVWKDKQFKKPLEPVKLLEDDNAIARRNAKVFRTLKAKGLI